MKLQVAATLCALMLVASEKAVTSEAAGCNVAQLVSCVDASRNEDVTPAAKCCDNISKIMGQNFSGAKCLCSLLSQPLFDRQGHGQGMNKEYTQVAVHIALGIPQRCSLPVPRGWVCQGVRVPGG